MSDDEPLGDLRREVESRDDDEKRASVPGDLFTEMAVDEVDSEAVWTELLLEDGPEEGSFPVAERTEGDDGTYQVVPKRLCHRCEHFGDPPTLHCTHEGTTIHELADMDHYRVTACPMVDPDADDDTT